MCKDKTVLIVRTPQFERTSPVKNPVVPKDFEFIKHFRKQFLLDIGCGIWTQNEESIHWLFPKEWYDHIPEGYNVVTVTNKVIQFKKGETSNDIRHGLLGFGFVQRKEWN